MFDGDSINCRGRVLNLGPILIGFRFCNESHTKQEKLY
jgi:hypothetical protein